MRIVTYRSERGERSGVQDGDSIVATGTPAGVGSTRKPAWLKPGDEITIASPTLGELRTTIA